MLLNYIRLAIRNRNSERGATAVEYGLLIAVIALFIIGGMVLLSDQISALFGDAASEMQDRGR